MTRMHIPVQRCVAVECETPAAAHSIFCASHENSLPKTLREQLAATEDQWIRGLVPARHYMEVVASAAASLANAEGRAWPEWLQNWVGSEVSA